MDLRNKDNSPCLRTFAKMESAELQRLCILAIENQMKALIEAEGEDGCRKLLHNLKQTLGDVSH